MPTQLKEFGVRDRGRVLLPRGWMSYRDKKTKAELLRIGWVLPAAKAVPRPGDPAKATDAASQLYMGFMLGQDRSTTNRHLRLFCGPDAKVAQFFEKWRPSIGCVNHYNYLHPDQSKEATDKKNVLKTLDPEKLAAKFGEDLFDAGAEGCGGSGQVALWTYDGNVPKTYRCGCKLGQMKFYADRNCLKCGGKGYTVDPDGDKMGPSARLVLTVLQLKGIAKWGYLDITCRELADLTGLCVNTVAAALDEWENLKILHVVPGDVVYEDFVDPKTGKPAVKCRKPQRIRWLVGELMDHQVVDRERIRFAEALQRARLQFGNTLVLQIAARRHQELLVLWLLSQKSIGSAWSYLRTWLRRRENIVFTLEGREQEQIDTLFPIWKAWDSS